MYESKQLTTHLWVIYRKGQVVDVVATFNDAKTLIDALERQYIHHINRNA